MTSEDAGTTNEFSGAAENVVQAHTVQSVYFGASTDDRVAISVVHHKKEVDFTGLTCVLSVTVENRGDVERHLFLKAVGYPDVRLDTPEMRVGPGDTVKTKVTLQRTGTSPEADRCRLQVQAVDAGGDGSGRWGSKVRTVVIPAEPAMSVQAERLMVASGGEHEATLWIKNEGNVRLTGRVYLPDGEWLRDNRPGDITNFLTTRTSREIDDFEVGTEESTRVTAVVTVPDQRLLRRSFRVMFVVSADDPGVDEERKELHVVQDGKLREIPRYVERFFALRGQRKPFRVGRIMDSLVAALVIGVVLGLLFSSAPREAGRPMAAAGVPTTSSPEPSTPDLVAAEGGAPVKMPCDAETSIVSLEVVFGPEGAKYAKYLVAYQNEYIARVAPDIAGRYQVHYSTYDQICPAVKGNFYPEGAYYVWLGPMQSAGLDGICAALRRKSPEFCLVYSVG
ncbi:hypothetical protein FKR81_00550 [Lentzea tibetensis]|uniref:Uncharacterized protein n=1 Tax=Lentzea tibetensis TaxID=2591470 RepID=A0A563F282_9PSEU|nr:hypothetical protein [Lentzea tibetensis]TWP54096.1 hypothetical protein FKR81_00550 [Lentzea tibetensis]